MILLVRISGASTFAAPVAVRAATPTNVALTNPGFESPYLVSREADLRPETYPVLIKVSGVASGPAILSIAAR
jgi:hypothetical protein